MADIETAISQANLWAVEAYQVIQALGLVREAQALLGGATHPCVGSDEAIVAECAKNLLESVRLGRELAVNRQNSGIWSHEFYDSLNRSVISVEEAIRKVEDES